MTPVHFLFISFSFPFFHFLYFLLAAQQEIKKKLNLLKSLQNHFLLAGPLNRELKGNITSCNHCKIISFISCPPKGGWGGKRKCPHPIPLGVTWAASFSCTAEGLR